MQTSRYLVCMRPSLMGALARATPCQAKKEMELCLGLSQHPEVKLTHGMRGFNSACWAQQSNKKNVVEGFQGRDPYRHQEGWGQRSAYRANTPVRAKESWISNRSSVRLDGFADVDEAIEYRSKAVGPTTENDRSKPAANNKKILFKPKGGSKNVGGSDEGERKKPSKSPKTKKAAQEGADGSTNKQGRPQKEYSLSPAMADLVGVQSLSRPQTLKKLWEYIKANNLQNPEDKREIICDEPMKRVFGVGRYNMLQTYGLIAKHAFDKSK